MTDNYKLGVVAYLPPKRLYPTDSFMANMKNFPTKNPLVLFSDEYEAEGVIKLNGNVEIAKDPKNKLAVNNLIFFTGTRIAASKGFSHVLLLENDCRVGKRYWDEILFEEFLSKNVNAIAGGSIAIFNPSCYTREAAARFEKYVADSLADRPCPMSITGSSNLAEKRDSCVFPNGAFAIYKMDWIIKTFPEITAQGKTVELARRVKTWDYAIGIKAWEEFRERVYDMIVPLNSVYSGYGNIMSTEDERKQWLIDGKVIGVHQIKSDWIGPEPKPEQDLFTPQVTMEIPKPPPTQDVTGKTEIFIVTYAKDFQYLNHCLRSIKKFAKGFSGVTVLVPTKDAKELRQVIRKSGLENVKVKHGYEWAKKGMCWHLAQECRADVWCPDADYIAHFDSDCIFTKPVSPETFFKNGKPLLRYEPFATLGIRHPGTMAWKIATENALPFPVNDEFMRGLPHIYHHSVYAKTRILVEQKTAMPFTEYVRSGRNEYPQQFCEYVTLGSVAAHEFRDDYYMVDLSKESNPDRSPYPVQQFWGHGPLDQPQEIWVDGIKRTVTPIKMIEEILK